MSSSTRFNLARVAMILVLWCAWAWASGGFARVLQWAAPFSVSAAWTTGIILAIYVVGILILLKLPMRHPDPQRGMATGCLGVTAAAITALELLFGILVYFHFNTLVKMICTMTLFSATPLAAQGTLLGFKKWRKKWQDKQTWIRPERIAALLSGKTHVVRRDPTADAAGWTELRHYGADGMLRIYREADEKTTLSEGPFAWTVKDGGLVIAEATGQVHFILMKRRDGVVSYFRTDPQNPRNAVLAFRAEMPHGPVSNPKSFPSTLTPPPRGTK